MKLQLFNYECKNCGKTFKLPQISSYGEFLMRSRTGDIVYLNSFKDSVFGELENIFKESKTKFSQITKSNQIEIFQTIFSVTCDRAPDGSAYNIRTKPTCPHCHQIGIKNWGPTNPLEIVDIVVKPVTHEYWNKLANEEKKKLVDEAIEIYLKNS